MAEKTGVSITINISDGNAGNIVRLSHLYVQFILFSIFFMAISLVLEMMILSTSKSEKTLEEGKTTEFYCEMG